MKIEIDPKSGFCFGVVKAIKKAEDILENGETLYCLGDLVHNSVEMKRLQEKGLITISHDEFKNISNTTVLIRAHGEPPETYEIAKKNNINLIDATCPVVLHLQKKVKAIYEKNKDTQIVIFGKKGHAEVNGLIGQVKGNAIVISSIEELDKIDFTKPIALFSQTTQSTEKYFEIIEVIKERSRSAGKESMFTYTNSICGQVSSREKELERFASDFDVIIFVSGKHSSNGKALFEVCKSVNKSSYFISEVEDIDIKWFDNCSSIGICGATSTPRWLMEKIAQYLKNLFEHHS